MQSKSNSLNLTDIKEWLIQTLIYSVIIPGALAVILALQNGIDFKTALGMGSMAIVTSVTNLAIKYKM